MSSVRLVRQIAARPETVFEAITTTEGLARWFGPDAGPVLSAELNLRVGGSVRIRFRMLDASEHECSGEIVELQPPTHLAMTWQWLGRESEGHSRVEYRLRATTLGTELTFTHTQLPDEAAARDHERGWNGAFDKLQLYMSAPKTR